MATKKKLEPSKLVVFIQNEDFFTSGDYEFDMVTEFKKTAAFWKYEVSLIFIDQKVMKDHDYTTFMQDHGYIGSFMIGFSKEDIWVKQLVDSTIPTILLDCETPDNPYVSCVGSDHIKGMEYAVSYLAKTGHSAIGLINGPECLLANRLRHEGYVQSMKNHELRPLKKLYANVDESTTIRSAVIQMIKAKADAVICGSDKIASTVMNEYRIHGYRTPQDISIIGYQNLSLCEKSFPQLTSIAEHRAQLGYFAFSSLRDLMMGMHLEQVRLRTELMIRGSVRE